MTRLRWLLVAIAMWIPAVPASAQLFLSIDSPEPNAVVGDTVSIGTTVMGAFSRVEASVGAHTASWTTAGGGQLSLVGEPYGMKTLTVTAYDNNNAPTSKTVQILLDRPPAVFIDAPAFGQVIAPGNLTVQAHCVDDGPSACTVAPVGTIVIDAAMEGRAFTVSVVATDSGGQTTTTEVPTFVESSPRLHEVVHGAAGDVLDFDGTRALIRSPDLHVATVWTASSGPTTVYQGEETITSGQLFPEGALVNTSYVSDPQKGGKHGWVWDGTTASIIGAAVRSAGSWLAYLKNIPPPAGVEPADAIFAQVVVLRDRTSGAEPFTSDTLPGRRIQQFLLAENGDLWWQDDTSLGVMSLRRSGVLSTPEGDARPLGDPKLDDFHLAAGYRGSLQSIGYLYSSTGREVLCSVGFPLVCPTPALNAGWIGYGIPANTSVDPTSSNRLFRRSPAGAIEELTGFDAAGQIAAISPTGEVAVESTTRRYLGGAGQAPIDISSNLGRVIYLDGWYVLLGRSVFAVGDASNGQLDAGIPDGGTTSGATDAAVADATDAGVGPDASLSFADASLDAGRATDAGPPPGADAGSDVPPEDSDKHEDSGCSLVGGRTPDSTLPMVMLIAGMWLVRRRRSRRRGDSIVRRA